MYNSVSFDKYMGVEPVISNISLIPYSTHSYFQILATTNLFCVPIVLPLLECYLNRII